MKKKIFFILKSPIFPDDCESVIYDLGLRQKFETT